MSTSHRLVVELEVDLHENWDDQTLIENVATYVSLLLEKSQREDGGDTPYSVDPEEVTVWTQQGYADDHWADAEVYAP